MHPPAAKGWSKVRLIRVQAVRTINPAAVVIGAPRLADGEAASDVVRALREVAPLTAVYLGGPGATPEYALGGSTLGEAAGWLADLLSGAGSRPDSLGPGVRGAERIA